MYKVVIDTVALMPDGEIGNIYQDRMTIYTNCDLTRIEEKINEFLKPKKLVCEIVIIEHLKKSYVIGVK